MTDVEAGAAEVHDAPRVGRRDDWRPSHRRRPAGARRPCGRGSLPTARVGARRTPHPRRSTGPRRRVDAGHRRAPSTVRPRRGPSGHGGGGTDPGRRPRGLAAASRERPVRATHSGSPPHGPRTLAPRACRAGGRTPSCWRRIPQLTTIGADPGIDAITRRASALLRRRDRRARAALHSTPLATRACDLRAPAARITRAVRGWVSRIHASITQPVNSQASGSPPSATSNRRRLRGRRPRHAEPFGTRCRRWPTRAHHVSEQHGVVRQRDAMHRTTQLPVAGRGSRRPGNTALRVSSMRCPNCTPERARRLAPPALHAFVHRSGGTTSIRRAPLLDGAHRRDATARRRGSRPVTRYVGQCGRQSPQLTHATSMSSSRSRGVVDFGVTGALTAGAGPVRACRSDRTRA